MNTTKTSPQFISVQGRIYRRADSITPTKDIRTLAEILEIILSKRPNSTKLWYYDPEVESTLAAITSQATLTTLGKYAKELAEEIKAEDEYLLKHDTHGIPRELRR